MEQGTYAQLVEALRLCALPYRDQAGALPEFVFVPDEVVGQWDDAFRRLTKLERLRAGPRVRRLERLFSLMSDASDREWLWSPEAMSTDPRWERVRAMAGEALARLGKPLRRPIFPNSTWIGQSSTGEVVAIRGDAVPIREADESAN